MDAIEFVASMYDQERQDERAFWASTNTLLIGALSVAGLILLSLDGDWRVQLVSPFVLLPVFLFYIQQAGVGARRRWYMAALENYLQEKCPDKSMAIMDSKKHGKVIVPLAAYTRYSWWMNTDGDEWSPAPPFAVRLLFITVNAMPTMLVAVVLAASTWQVSDHHQNWAIAEGAISAAGWVLGLFFLRVLTNREKMAETWRATIPAPFSALNLTSS